MTYALLDEIYAVHDAVENLRASGLPETLMPQLLELYDSIEDLEDCALLSAASL